MDHGALILVATVFCVPNTSAALHVPVSKGKGVTVRAADFLQFSDL